MYGILALTPYSATTDYALANIVYDDTSNKVYICKQISGPSTVVVDPSTDGNNEYWGTFESGDIDWNDVIAFPSAYDIEDTFALNNITLGRANIVYASKVTNAILRQGYFDPYLEQMDFFLNATILNNQLGRYAFGEKSLSAFETVASRVD